MGAMILAPQTLHAQSVNIKGLDSLRLSGSVSVVEPELLKKGMLNNALDALSGQTAGVNVTTNGLDRIAMLNSVRVRGTTSIMGGNDPLVIVDGVTSDVATLATIYPADIESFTVLKNASETALYGSRGASGVIQVKTKKGTGKGFQISYEGNYGIEAMYKSMEMLNAAEYIAAAQKYGLEYNNKGFDTNFRMALTRTLKAYAEADPTISKQIEKAKVEIAPEDFREGLTAVISIKVAEPQFEGQTKTKLGNSEVQGAVQQAVNEALSDYLEEHPDEAKRICEKVVLAATARIAARKARESVQRKNFMTGGGLPGKLADCSMKDPKECEIFLVEGDSAGGSAKQGRDRFRQAILPLRGKILNVEKVQWHKVFEAESVMNIIQSIGVRFGVDGEDSKEANTDKLRYDKIIIMTDADVDGSHIDTLIMTLFYRFMPKVIEEGHLYIATPPLYKCTYRNKVSEYCYTEQQRQAFIDKYGDGTEDKNIHTQRYKGLGEMNPEQLWETTMDPSTRLLKQVTIENAAQADEIFSMLMGDDVEPRREFIEQNATYANIDA